MSVLLSAVATLGVIGAGSASFLYFVGKKFHVDEDPRIKEVEEALPAANCGGCGFPGCAAFAEACVVADNLDKLNCPVGGQETMNAVADILGTAAGKSVKQIAVVRCSGDCEVRPRLNLYDGVSNCSIAAALYGGDTGCSYGCLGMGDCVAACDFDAIHMNPITKLPEVVEDKCTACNACVIACPKDIIELRNQGPRSRRIFVSCVNEDKGGPARRSCKVACIGCSKCYDVCAFDAITMKNNLAYIDYDKCRLCRKCVPVCPTNSIHELNFPPPRKKVEKKPEVAEA